MGEARAKKNNRQKERSLILRRFLASFCLLRLLLNRLLLPPLFSPVLVEVSLVRVAFLFLVLLSSAFSFTAIKRRIIQYIRLSRALSGWLCAWQWSDFARFCSLRHGYRCVLEIFKKSKFAIKSRWKIVVVPRRLTSKPNTLDRLRVRLVTSEEGRWCNRWKKW